MNRYLPCSILKKNARTQLFGKLGTVIGAFLVHILCLMPLYLCLEKIGLSTWQQIIIYVLADILLNLIGSVFSLGESLLYLKNASGGDIGVLDVFYGFQGQIAKVIKVRLIPVLVTVISEIPIILLSNVYTRAFAEAIPDMDKFMSMYREALFSGNPAKVEALMAYVNPLMPLAGLLVLAYLFQILVIFIVGVVFGLSYYVILDYPELSAKDTILYSIRLLKGNVGRYVYMRLSFIPWIILAPFTCMISYVWFYIYRGGTMANFYLDLVNKKMDKGNA